MPSLTNAARLARLAVALAASITVASVAATANWGEGPLRVGNWALDKTTLDDVKRQLGGHILLIVGDGAEPVRVCLLHMSNGKSHIREVLYFHGNQLRGADLTVQRAPFDPFLQDLCATLPATQRTHAGVDGLVAIGDSRSQVLGRLGKPSKSAVSRDNFESVVTVPLSGADRERFVRTFKREPGSGDAWTRQTSFEIGYTAGLVSSIRVSRSVTN